MISCGTLQLGTGIRELFLAGGSRAARGSPPDARICFSPREVQEPAGTSPSGDKTARLSPPALSRGPDSLLQDVRAAFRHLLARLWGRGVLQQDLETNSTNSHCSAAGEKSQSLPQWDKGPLPCKQRLSPGHRHFWQPCAVFQQHLKATFVGLGEATKAKARWELEPCTHMGESSVGASTECAGEVSWGPNATRACVPASHACAGRGKSLFAMCCVQRGARRATGLVVQSPAAGGSRSGEDSKAPGVTGSGEEDEEAKVTLAKGMQKDQEMSRPE